MFNNKINYKIYRNVCNYMYNRVKTESLLLRLIMLIRSIKKNTPKCTCILFRNLYDAPFLRGIFFSIEFTTNSCNHSRVTKRYGDITSGTEYKRKEEKQRTGRIRIWLNW